MTTNKIYINQSLVKDLIKYQNDELCGLVFHNKWILQQFGGGSKANDLGRTGLPKTGRSAILISGSGVGSPS
jgi:hypothetical protein